MYVHIIGTVSRDENCLFRALANAITRSQTQRNVLRMYIARYMAEAVVALKLQLLFSGADRQVDSHVVQMQKRK